MSAATGEKITERLAEDVRLARSSHWLGGFIALFQASCGRYLWSKRMLVLALLFCLPGFICIMARKFDEGPQDDKWYLEGEMGIILIFIPTILTPLAALVFGSGMIQDEIEEQTLTYLLVRPVPRWAIYVAKLLAILLATTVLSVVFTMLTYVCLRMGTDNFIPDILPKRSLKAASLLALSTAAYCSAFALGSLLVKRALTVGVIYIILFEGVLGAIPFNLRLVTVVYYYRVLAIRWLGLDSTEWNIEISEAPTNQTCLLVFVGVTVISTVLAGMLMTRREFRMKTPAAA